MGTQSQHSSNAESRKRPREIDSDALFQGSREVVIRFQGETYRLRITRNNKLILTK
ncbi:MAG: hemin uptake protein HemP [Pseudomonadota bacterium]